jgi:hypothetical protein
LRSVISRRVDKLRREWANGIRKVVQAPAGSHVLMVAPTTRGRGIPSGNIRLTDDPDAVPVILTRDSNRTDGVFIREEIADGIFDEINNVIDANRALAKGQRRFMLGSSLYYRIYAERQHVSPRSAQVSLLMHAAVTEMYAPSLFWFRHLSDAEIAVSYCELFLRPRSPQIHALLRIAMLLGKEFRAWLLGKWKDKWRRHPQPPTFFFTFQQMCDGMNGVDSRAAAARLGPSKLIECRGERPTTVSELLKDGDAASALLSRTCMRVFEGRGEERSAARDLDYITYGQSVCERSSSIAEAIISGVDDTGPGDFASAATG